MFEGLQLEEFGNRIPTLTFEVIADDGELSLATMCADVVGEIDAAVPLPGLVGLSCEGPIGELLTQLEPAYPMDCEAGGALLTIAPERLQAEPVQLGEAAISAGDGDFGAGTGHTRRRASPGGARADLLRYYDIDRDFQPGTQRAPGRPEPGEPRTIELPAALAAGDARRLIAGAARRSRLGRETLSWRTAELDPRIGPGSVVAVPGNPGRWRVEEWEWRAQGVELALTRLPGYALAAASPAGGAPGRLNPPIDAVAAPTVLAAFELPWDGDGAGDRPRLFAAGSSGGAGWKGAALYVDRGDGQLLPLDATGRARAVIGMTIDALPPASPLLLDRSSAVLVRLAGTDLSLTGADTASLALARNLALIGDELIQFGSAVPLGAGLWRLGHLLRGRGGTERAIDRHGPDEGFVLLGSGMTALDPAIVGTAPGARIAALGLADPIPVTSAIACRGVTQRPLCPVHPRCRTDGDGALALAWTRRARGAWSWSDSVEVPLHEETEAYEVSYGPASSPIVRWTTSAPLLAVPAATLAELAAALPGGTFQVRQIGSYALSDPLLLTALP